MRSSLAVAAAVVLAACGSSSNSSSTTTGLAASSTTPNAGKLTAARVAAASCIRAQGINIPDPRSNGSLLTVARILASYPQAKVQAAEKACASQIKAAFPQAASLTPAQRQLRLKAAKVFASCMRAHGINFPDPSTAAANPTAFAQALQSLDINSPAYKSAGTTCRAQTLKETGG